MRKKINAFQIIASLFEVAGAGKIALRFLEKALQNQPDRADLHLQASRVFLMLGQIDRAALHCKKAAAGIGTGSFIYWLNRAANGGIKSNLWEKETFFDHLEDFSTIPEAPAEDKISQFNNSGLCLLENNRFQEALTCFEQAMSLGGQNAAVLFNTGLALSKLGNHQEALEYYSQAQARGFSTPELLNNKGYALFHLYHYDEALSCYEVARQFLPQDLGLLSNLASCYHVLGRVEEAISCYRSVIATCPGDPTLHNNLGICLEKIAAPEEALEHYQQAVDLSPQCSTFSLNYGHCLLSLGRHEDAFAVVSRILEGEPQNHQAWGLRGELLAEQGNMREAAECYGRALGLAG